MELGEGVIVQHTQALSGSVTVRIDPKSITVSRKRQESTARNNLPGVIVSLAKKNGTVRIVVDTGVRFHVDVTVRSCRALDLALDTPVWISFKASSVTCFQLFSETNSEGF